MILDLEKKLQIELEIIKSQIPLENRLADPSEVAEVIHFLCTEGANYITGENILITGGYSMH